MNVILSFFLFAVLAGAQILTPISFARLPNTPTASPGAGTYSSTQSVTLTDATASTIFYTTTGTNPNCLGTSGTRYTGAISISTTTTLKAIGCNGITGGGVLTSVYTNDTTFSPVYQTSGGCVDTSFNAACTITLSVTSGWFAVCGVGTIVTTNEFSCSDSNSDTFSADIGAQYVYTGHTSSAMFYGTMGTSATSEVFTIRCANSSGYSATSCAGTVSVYSGTPTSGWDVIAAGAGTYSSTSPVSITTGTTGTTSNAKELAVALFTVGNGVGYSAVGSSSCSNSFTQRIAFSDTNISLIFCDRILSSTGTITATGTYSPSLGGSSYVSGLASSVK